MDAKNKIENTENGFILYAFGCIVQCLHIISPVELIKRATNKNYEKEGLTDADKEKSSKLNNNIVDGFIILKWFYLIIAICNKWDSCFKLYIVFLLLFFNLFTYFYYHIWEKDSLIGVGFKLNRVRKRFIAVLLAIAFSHLSFAYLYYVYFPIDFTNNATNQFIHWFWYSASNAVAANYDAIKPLTCWGYHISMMQLLVSFIFLTLILSKSLPNAEKE